MSLQREGTDIPLGVQLISEDLGLKLEKVQSEMLGGAKKVGFLFLTSVHHHLPVIPVIVRQVHASFHHFATSLG